MKELIKYNDASVVNIVLNTKFTCLTAATPDSNRITLAVKETGVSRHNKSSVKDPPETPKYDSAVMVQWVSGGH